ncbi:unnamed protein product, partial [Adineta ricciae]
MLIKIDMNNGYRSGNYKVKGAFVDITHVCEQTARQYEHNAIPMRVVKPGRKPDRLDPSFMYMQIIKEFDDDYYYETFVNNEIDRKESEGNWSMNIHFELCSAGDE